MVADWSAVGLCRMEDYLALHAAFCDYLSGRPSTGPEEQGRPPEVS